MSPLVLLVDRDVHTREILRSAFEARGHRVLEAAGGAEGLRLVEEHAPDLVVGAFPMDVPGHSPFVDAARERSPHSRMISFTGRVLPEQVEAARAICDEVIAKPAEPLEVVSAAERLLGEG